MVRRRCWIFSSCWLLYGSNEGPLLLCCSGTRQGLQANAGKSRQKQAGQAEANSWDGKTLRVSNRPSRI